MKPPTQDEIDHVNRMVEQTKIGRVPPPSRKGLTMLRQELVVWQKKTDGMPADLFSRLLRTLDSAIRSTRGNSE